jgi:DNA polymerase-3 subunit beta
LSDLRFTIDREAFTAAINWVARTIPAKPINPILGGIRLTTDTDDGCLVLQAFDYEVSAAIRLPSADVQSRGESLVSGRLLAAISRAFPKKPVELQHDGPVVRIQCGAADFTLPTMSAGEFPLLPKFPAAAGAIDAEVFAEAAAQTVIAASHDEALIQINCVCLEVTSHETLTMFATDKHRIAMRTLPWTGGTSAPIGKQLLIPRRTINEIGRMGGESVTLGLDDNLLGISGDERRVTTRLIDAEYPNCRTVMPKEHIAIATIDVAEIAEAINRAILLDEREFPRVKLEFGEGALRLTGGKDGIGAIREDIVIEFMGEPIRLWVNPKYFLDGLNALRADKAYIGFTSEKRPFALAAHDGTLWDGSGPFVGLTELEPNYIHLVMPTAGDAR